MSTMLSGNKLSIRRVDSHPSDAELQKMVDMSVNAFSSDAFSSFMVGGYNGKLKSPCLMADLNRAMICAGLVGGHVYVAELADAGIVGVAIWSSPGDGFLFTEEQRNAGWADFKQKLFDLDADMKRWWEEYYGPLYDRSTKGLLPEPVTVIDAWHLVSLCVSKDHQRKGIGRALIWDCERTAITTADSKAPLYMTLDTETPEALTFYKSLGFEVKIEFIVEGPKAVGGSVTMWSLAKEVKAK